MGIDLLLVTLFLFFLWILGSSFLIISNKLKYSILALPLGLTLLALSTNILYFIFKLSLPVIQVLYLVLFVFCIAYIIFKIKKSCIQINILQFYIFVLFFLFLALPGFIGGEQYMAFRVNIWDHLNYMSAALALYDYPYGSTQLAQIMQSPEMILQNQVVAYGTTLSNARPMAYLLFSTLLTKGYGDIIIRAFYLTTAIYAIMAPAFLFCYQNLFQISNKKRLRLVLCYVTTFAFVAGFWGQMIFDIHAWSQLFATPLLMLMTVCYFLLLNAFLTCNKAKKSDINFTWVLTCLFSMAAFVTYPEAAACYAFILFCITIIASIYSKKILKCDEYIKIIFIPFSVYVGSVLPFQEGTLGFMLGQVSFAASTPVNWWHLYDAYWAGNASLLTFFGYYNFIVSFFGLPSLTVSPSWTLWGRILSSIFVFILSICILFSLWINTKCTLAGKKVRQLGLLVLISLCMVAGLFIFNKIWAAGKLYLYFIPFIFLHFTAMPFYSPFVQTQSTRTIVQLIACIMIVFNICFSFDRIISAIDPYGIGYPATRYPSTLLETLKKDIDWTFDPSPYTKCSTVKISAPSSLYLYYMKLKLTYMGIKYYTNQPLESHYVGLPLQIMPNVAYDCEVLVKIKDAHFNVLSGMDLAESWGRWTTSDVVEFEFYDTLPNQFVATLNVTHVFIDNLEIPISVQVGDDVVSFLVTNPGLYRFVMTPKSVEKKMSIIISAKKSPKDLNINSDSRKLGLGLSSLTIQSTAMNAIPLTTSFASRK